MSTATTFAAVLVSITALAAQSVGVTLSALTPLSVQTSVGAASSVNTLPAGVLPHFGTLATTLPAFPVGALVQWWVSPPTNQSVYLTVTHALTNNAALPTFAGRCGPHEFLVEFTSAIPRAATLTVARNLVPWPGAPVPTVQLDFDNDGVIDVPIVGTNTTYAVTVGPQPKQVRIVVDAQLSAQVSLGDILALILTPDNGLAIAEPVASCDAGQPPPPQMLQPSFDDRGIDLFLYSLPGQPSVLVFGFSPQPILLSMLGPLPCILLPSPDVVLLGNGLFHLPLPASVRPVTFYVQGVTLAPSGITTTTGYAVQAN